MTGLTKENIDLDYQGSNPTPCTYYKAVIIEMDLRLTKSKHSRYIFQIPRPNKFMIPDLLYLQIIFPSEAQK
jgi:hypothetical protein